MGTRELLLFVHFFVHFFRFVHSCVHFWRCVHFEVEIVADYDITIFSNNWP